jgi:hypothetical protein
MSNTATTAPAGAGAGPIDPEAAQELLARLVGYFDQAADASDTARGQAERDRDYYDGRQWSAAEEQQLLARGQAAIVVNRIKPKVDYLLGVERATRTKPTCLPRNPSDEHAAAAATRAVQFVLDDNDFDRVRSGVFETLLIEGAGFCEVVAEAGGPGGDGAARVRVHPIAWDRAFFDPHARRRDMEDARYRGQVIWMDLDEARAKYPERHEAIEAAFSQGDANDGDTYGDRPARWADRRRRRVRIVEVWYREGRRVMQAVFCRGGLLKGPLSSPYTDDEGRPEDPYVFCSAFVTREGERYGAVRQLVGIQDEINKRRSKALHLLSVRQVRAEKGAVEDMAQAKRELARPDGWIETVPGFDFELLPTGDMAAAQFQLLSEAKGEIDAVGANAALTGKGFSDASGRAIQARQQGGQLELGPLFDTLRAWQARVARKAWGRIRQFWTAPRWVRITDDPHAPAWVGLNRPVTLADELTRELGAVPPELSGDPRLGAIVRVENDLAVLDVDIVVGEAPDTVVLRQEQFAVLADLARSGVPIPPEALIEASGLPDKDRLLALLRGDPAAQLQADAEAKQARALQAEKLIGEISEKRARADKYEAEAGRTRMATVRMAAGG